MKKLLIGGGIIVVAIVVAFTFLLGNINSIVKKGVESAGPVILQAPVTLNKVDISVSSGTGQLSGLTVGNPKGFKTDFAFQLGDIKLDIDTKSLASDTIHIKSIIIDSPKIIYEGLIGDSNISKLQSNASAFTGQGGSSKDKGSSKGSSGKKVVIDYLKIAKGSIGVSMSILQGKDLSLPLPTLELRDIGKKKSSTFSDVLNEILAAINEAAIPAIKSGIPNLGDGLKMVDEGLKKAGSGLQDTAKQLGGGATDGIQGTAEKGLNSLKGMFGK